MRASVGHLGGASVVIHQRSYSTSLFPVTQTLPDRPKQFRSNGANPRMSRMEATAALAV
jgi:hypothetical protein